MSLNPINLPSNFITYSRTEVINGEGSIEESSGSSHKVLRDSTGKKVTGIFAHNKGMTYTKRTIPYLYAAIQMLGDERLMGVEDVSG